MHQMMLKPNSLTFFSPNYARISRGDMNMVLDPKMDRSRMVKGGKLPKKYFSI